MLSLFVFYLWGIAADVGYDRRCQPLPLVSLLSLLSLMSMRLVCCLVSEFDTAGLADALENPLLLSSDGIVADVELDQRPFAMGTLLVPTVLAS
jgi:hypothetical protein